jgi:hypothetical protein
MVGELVRRPQNSPHVTAPLAPEILYGIDPEEVARRAIEMAEQGQDLLGRSVKQDAKVLASMVASWPEPWENAEVGPRDLKPIREWADRFISFAKKEFPGHVGCVALHWDELRPNLHALLLPELRLRRLQNGKEVLHFSILPADPLRAAARAVKLGPTGLGNGRHAAAIAGTAFQTRYARDVGYPTGMLRAQVSALPGRMR